MVSHKNTFTYQNYYINLCIKEQLSKRELVSRIKNNSYERLLEKPDKIEILNDGVKYEYNILDELKNPIVIKLNSNEKPESEKELQILLLAHLKNVFEDLGQGFLLVGNEYKIKYNGKTYKIDLLLFNTELNCYVVVELKLNELKPKDKGQIEFYMYLVDKTLKRDFHKETIGIIISKHMDEYVITFFKKNSDKTIIPLEYIVEG